MDGRRWNKGVDVTPSDTVDLTAQGTFGNLTSGLYVGGAGDVAVVWQDGSVTVFTVTAAYPVLEVNCRRVNATNTTATKIKALYRV